MSGILLSYGAFASCKKANIAGHKIQLMDTKDKTHIPYVSDGLVAMWDAEWNVGLGRHYPACSIWTDIVGGLRLNIQYGTFTKDGLFGTSSQPLNVVPLDDFTNLKTILTNTSCTVEAVCTPLSLLANGYNFYNIYMLYSIYNSSHIFDWIRCHSAVMSLVNYGTIGEPISFSTTSYADSDIYPGSIMYINGDFKFKNRFTPQNPSSRFLINIKGGMHCIRIYDRTLNAEEIAYNYEIDKERFNLQ